MKKWQIAPAISDAFINEFPEINSAVLQLLFNRDIRTQDKIDEFLYPDFHKDIHDPFYFKDMKKAVQRIISAVKKKEKVLVYGDYDADGVTSSVVIVSTLKMLGLDAEVYIPHRETEGYGMNAQSVRDLIEKKYNLVITVDCGISNREQVREITKNGIDVIITDHHHAPPKLPDAFAIINAKVENETYPWKELAGVGAAFKLMQGLLTVIKEKKIISEDIFKNYGGISGFEKWLLDLVSIGTVADCMPMFSENRTLVKYGLIVLRKTKRIGLRELIAHANIKIDTINTVNIAFQLGPRINAAGRVDHANIAYELLLTDDTHDACTLSNRLNETNTLRQKVTEEIISDVNRQLSETEKKKVLFAIGEDWMTGVIGLVAGKICDIHNKPAVIMSKLGGEIVGSGRSISQFNMIEALEKMRKYFSQYGGHSQACGFTLKDNDMVNAFMADLEKAARDELKEKDITPVLDIDAQINLEDIDWEMVEQIELFAPFGEGNREPLFQVNNLEIVELSLVGQTKDHIRLLVRENNTFRKAIAFGIGGTWGKQLKPGDYIDVVCNISINEWNGNKEIQLKFIDLRFS